jgi:hypothetical protein
MRQVSLLVLIGIFSLCALLSCAWLILFPLYLLKTGGTYGYSEGETIVCRVPIFTEDNWFRVSLLLFGLPLALLLASIQLIRFTKGQRALGKLP